MKHLVRRPQVGLLVRILPCRFSIFRFPKTVSSQDSYPLLKTAALRERRKNMEHEVRVVQDIWRERLKKYSELGSINSRDKNMEHEGVLSKKVRDWREGLEKRSELIISIYRREMDGEDMESEGVPIEMVLASYMLVSQSFLYSFKFLSKLEKKGPKGIALATMRKTERLLFSYDYDYMLRPRVFMHLMFWYRLRGEKEDIRRLRNLPEVQEDKPLFGMEGTVRWFLRIKDIEGAYKDLEEWDISGDIRNLVVYGDQRKFVMEKTKKIANDMVKDHNKEEEEKKRAMEVRRNGWDPKKNLVLSAYACVEYVEGRRDIESAADDLRLLGNQKPQDAISKKDAIMDRDRRLSQKMVEAMRGGGYFGEQE